MVRKILMVFFACSFVISILLMVVKPSKRVGPFGIALPADLIEFEGQYFPFTISYPESWIMVELLHGDHGDMDVIGGLDIPGRSWPSARIVRKAIPAGTLQDVVAWEQKRVSAENYDGYQSLEQTIDTSAGPRYIHEYSHVQPGLFHELTVKCRAIFLLKDSLGYGITLCAEEQHWQEYGETFHAILDSFEVR